MFGRLVKAQLAMPAAASPSNASLPPPSTDPLGDFLTQQLTQVNLLHLGLTEAFTANPVAALVMLGVVLLALSLFCRFFIYGCVRVSGKSSYNNAARVTENLYLIFAAGFGGLCGEICFQNLWLAACAAVGFAVISIGAVIEGLSANENNNDRKHREGMGDTSPFRTR